jgi:hypothetical protein
MSREIPLTQGQFAIVDDEDYEYLNRFKWCAVYDKKMGSFYAARKGKCGNSENLKFLSMHREIMNPPENMSIDHINHNTIDNRRCNLRICTQGQNVMNVIKRSDNTSGYKGVSWKKSANRWCAQLRANGKCVYSMYFTDKIEAAKAYDDVAKKFHGEFAYLNFPE